MVGLDGPLLFLHTESLLKAFIHSSIKVHLALLLCMACGMGWLCLALESGVQGCAGSVWSHHPLRADLGDQMPGRHPVTSCWWPEIGHDGSAYVMEIEKACKTDWHSSLQRACFQYITALD